MSRVNNEIQVVYNEYSTNPITTNDSIKYSPKTWTDYIEKILQKRGLEIANNTII